MAASRWVDIAVACCLAYGAIRGFSRGLIREVFSLVGTLFAVAVAYEGYQELSWHLQRSTPLSGWQAQIISFVLLVLGISLLAAMFGWFWSRVIRLTPFAILDNIAGAGLGMIKVVIVIIIVAALLVSTYPPLMEEVLKDSLVVQQTMLVLPLIYDKLAEYWPVDWPRPDWLFPQGEEAEWEHNYL